MMKRNLPQGWEVKTLGEIFLIERGSSPRPIKEYLTTDSGGINWIKIGDTKNITKYITETAQKIKPEGKKYSRFVEIGDLILSNSMSFGKPYIMKTTGCIHDGWVVFKQDKKVIDEEFCYYILSSSEIYAQFDKLATGSTVKNLNIERIKQIQIPLPPLEIQQKIVAKLESEFAKIASAKSHLEKVKETIPRLKNSLLKSAFSGELTQPCKDERGMPYRHCEDLLESEAHNPQGFCSHLQTHNTQSPQDSIAESKACKIVDCHELRCNSRNDASITQAPNLGGATSVAQNLQSDTNPPNYPFSNAQYDKENNLPQGWEVKTLGEVCEKVQKRSENYKELEFDYIDISSVNNKAHTIEKTERYNVANAPSRAQQIVQSDDVLFSNVRTYLKNIAFVNEKYNDCIASTGFCVIRVLKDILLPKFMFYQALSDKFVLSLNKLQRGSSYPAVRNSDIFMQNIVAPPLETQKQIVEILDSKFAALEKLEKETNASLEKLQKLKSSLLNLAFRGELIC